MDMSEACLPPIQPSVTEAERKHPRFPEYQRYVASMRVKLVRASEFQSWLNYVEETERGYEVVFHTKPGASLAQGWYKHKFAPHTRKMTRFGPFDTREQAEKS